MAAGRIGVSCFYCARREGNYLQGPAVREIRCFPGSRIRTWSTHILVYETVAPGPPVARRLRDGERTVAVSHPSQKMREDRILGVYRANVCYLRVRGQSKGNLFSES